MQEVLYAVAVPVSLGWIFWVSRGIVNSARVQEKVMFIGDSLERVENKIDRLVERFL